MRNLKERLEPVKLSDVQRQRILQNVKGSRFQQENERRWKLGPFIASSILAVAGLFILIALLSEPTSLLEQGAESSTASNVKLDLSIKAVILATVASISMVISYIALQKNLHEVKRWQTTTKLRAYMDNKICSTIFYIVGLAVIWSGTLLLTWAELYVQIWFSMFCIFSIFMWQIWLTRDNEWCKCPHCGTPLTRKAIRKKTTWYFRETCDECGKRIYLIKRAESIVEVVGLPFVFFMYYSFFDLNPLLTIITIVTVIWFTLRYIMPYSYQFDKEPDKDEKLW